MCTLILAWQVFDGTPVAVAANRDEALGRPSNPPRLLDTDPRVVAPQDEKAGGTWVGYNDSGLFVGVTNRRTALEGDRSRGLLVRDALACQSSAEAVALVEEELAEHQYAGFNLVVADDEAAALLEWDGVLKTTYLDPGVHVVVNEGYDEAAPKAARIWKAIRPDPETPVETWFEQAKAVLRDHDLDACIHGEDYGTRSSSLIRIASDGTGRYWFADGRPCETDYEAVEIADGQV